MTQTITINLSDRLYRQLQQVAKLSSQPLEAIVAQSLVHSLPPLLEDIPREYQPDVYPLLQMSKGHSALSDPAGYHEGQSMPMEVNSLG